MDPAIKAAETAIARDRIQAAATALAERYGLDAQVAAVSDVQRAPLQVRDLYQMRAVADLLDAIVTAGSDTTQPDADTDTDERAAKPARAAARRR